MQAACKEKILNYLLVHLSVGGLLLPSCISPHCSSCLVGEKRIFVGSPGFNPRQSRTHPKISFPSLHQLFTFVFHWLGQGSALGHFSQALSVGSCFLHERQSFPWKAWVLRYGECTGCSSLEQGTCPGLGQQQQAWAGAAGSPCGVSQGWDIPRLQWLCLGRWQLLAQQAGKGIFLESPNFSVCSAAGAEESCVSVQPSRHCLAGH